jgi:hypothetical protein
MFTEILTTTTETAELYMKRAADDSCPRKQCFEIQGPNISKIMSSQT